MLGHIVEFDLSFQIIDEFFRRVSKCSNFDFNKVANSVQDIQKWQQLALGNKTKAYAIAFRQVCCCLYEV
jgi:hypothetical protein